MSTFEEQGTSKLVKLPLAFAQVMLVDMADFRTAVLDLYEDSRNATTGSTHSGQRFLATGVMKNGRMVSLRTLTHTRTQLRCGHR